MSIGSKLKELRERQGLTQAQLAALAGLEQSHISLIENGRRPKVAAVVVARLAQALGVSVDTLLEIPDSREPTLQDMFSRIREMNYDEQDTVRLAVELVLARRSARVAKEALAERTV